MPRPRLDRPQATLKELLIQAEQLGLQVDYCDLENWPVWPADHPYRQSTCEKKKAYLALESAVFEAIRLFRQRGVKLRVYACPFGLHYHITRRKNWVEYPKGGSHGR